MSIINDDNNVLFPVPEQPENNTHSLDLTKAAYPTLALQKHWKTPTEFFCCPTVPTENLLLDYYHNLAISRPFSRNKFCEHTVLDFALTDDGQTLIIATKNTNPNDVKHFGLLKVYCSSNKLIHESISTYFEENGVRKYFTLAQGKERNGPDSIDDYC